MHIFSDLLAIILLFYNFIIYATHLSSVSIQLICSRYYAPEYSHRSSWNDGSRNDKPGTRNDVFDAFLHCGNENVPAFPSWNDRSRNMECCIVPVPR